MWPCSAACCLSPDVAPQITDRWMSESLPYGMQCVEVLNACSGNEEQAAALLFDM